MTCVGRKEVYSRLGKNERIFYLTYGHYFIFLIDELPIFYGPGPVPDEKGAPSPVEQDDQKEYPSLFGDHGFLPQRETAACEMPCGGAGDRYRAAVIRAGLAEPGRWTKQPDEHPRPSRDGNPELTREPRASILSRDYRSPTQGDARRQSGSCGSIRFARWPFHPGAFPHHRGRPRHQGFRRLWRDAPLEFRLRLANLGRT